MRRHQRKPHNQKVEEGGKGQKGREVQSLVHIFYSLCRFPPSLLPLPKVRNLPLSGIKRENGRITESLSEWLNRGKWASECGSWSFITQWSVAIWIWVDNSLSKQKYFSNCGFRHDTISLINKLTRAIRDPVCFYVILWSLTTLHN